MNECEELKPLLVANILTGESPEQVEASTSLMIKCKEMEDYFKRKEKKHYSRSGKPFDVKNLKAFHRDFIMFGNFFYIKK